MRYLYLTLGWLAVITGIVGAFLPVLPTTPFLLVAIWCFSRSSPKLEAWLLNHPKYGAPLRNWRENGTITRRAKISAVAIMSMSYAIVVFATSLSAFHIIIVGLIMAGPAIFLITRPEPK